MSDNFMKNLVLHIKYPYTAVTIAVMWLGIAIIIGLQQSADMELLVIATVVSSLIVAIIGFASPK
jgi:glucose-6-phosphate-specific signal transduction histidine kinase